MYLVYASCVISQPLDPCLDNPNTTVICVMIPALLLLPLLAHLPTILAWGAAGEGASCKIRCQPR